MTSYWRDAVTVRDPRYRFVGKIKDGEVAHQELYDLREYLDSSVDVHMTEAKVASRLAEIATSAEQ